MVVLETGTSWHNDAFKCWEKLCGGRLETTKLEIEKHEARVSELNRRLKKATCRYSPVHYVYHHRWQEAWCDDDGNEKDRYDYARRYDEAMARRALHEDLHTTKGLLSAPAVRDNYVDAEVKRLTSEGRTLSPLKDTFYEWRLRESLDAPVHLYSGPAIRACDDGRKAHESEQAVAQAKAAHAREAMEIAQQRKAERAIAASADAEAQEATKSTPRQRVGQKAKRKSSKGGRNGVRVTD